MGVNTVNNTIQYKAKLFQLNENNNHTYSPFDSNTSDVSLIVNGKSDGITGLKPFSASAP